MILFSEEAMILFSVILNFSLLEVASAISTENSIQSDDHRITQLPAPQYDCSKQYNLRQFTLIRIQNCTQSPSDFDYTRAFVSVFIRSNAKRS